VQDTENLIRFGVSQRQSDRFVAAQVYLDSFPSKIVGDEYSQTVENFDLNMRGGCAQVTGHDGVVGVVVNKVLRLGPETKWVD